MPKRPTKEDKNNVQLELFLTDETKNVLSTAGKTKKHYEHQSALAAKLYKHIKDKIVSADLTVAEIKQLADTLRNLSIWNKTFWEGMTAAEQAEVEKEMALGWDETNFDSMSDEELAKWI
jgi:hypothetical protein